MNKIQTNNISQNKTGTNFQNNYSYISSNKGRKFGVALASLAIPGLGQVINGETPKGIAFFLGSVCNLLILFKHYRKNTLGWIGRIGIGIWAAIDAAKRS